MTEEEIYKKIRDTYNSEKGRGFITHLLRSFFPVGTANFAFFSEEGKKYVCCITGQELSTKEELINISMSDEGQKAFIENLKAYSNAIVNGEKSYKHPESLLELRKKIKPLAVVSEKSDKCLSEIAFEQLQDFYINEMLQGNKHINWISNNERAKHFVEHGKKEGLISTRKEEIAVHKAVEHSGMKLGDLDALRAIKQRMETNEKYSRNKK